MGLESKYYDLNIKNSIFSAANQAAITSPVGLVASSLNYTLFNPPGNNKNIVLLDVTIGVNASPVAASTIWLTQNNNPLQAIPTGITPLTISTNFLSQVAGTAKAYSTATLAATPSILRVLASIQSGVSNGSYSIVHNIDGAIVVRPGTYVSIQASTAISLFCAMTWAEIDI